MPDNYVINKNIIRQFFLWWLYQTNTEPAKEGYASYTDYYLSKQNF